jgi:hypothetical protein
MTLPKKHSRQIVVAGICYRWCLGKKESQSTLAMGDRVVVEAADLNGATLVVRIGLNWDDEPSLTPRHVADFIEDAIRAGWRPLECGPQFEICSDSPRKSSWSD